MKAIKLVFTCDFCEATSIQPIDALDVIPASWLTLYSTLPENKHFCSKLCFDTHTDRLLSKRKTPTPPTP